MQKILEDAISLCQSAYVKGMMITNNVLLVVEQI